eukprot:NODE_90_length_21806_cov_0.389137.p10 type:complete len:123 gc:universal NODE_90_length_21806_cov_0.389137:9249-9617(+)
MKKGFGFNKFLFKNLTENGSKYKFTPTEDHLNLFETVHGGIISSLVDVTTSLEIYKIKQDLGVSVDLNVQYMKPLTGPFTLEPVIDKLGKSLVFTTCFIYNDLNQLAALGRHLKTLNRRVNK